MIRPIHAPTIAPPPHPTDRCADLQGQHPHAPGEAGTLLKTGIVGLDSVLGGGFPANRLYLIEGHPGSGKTTLALSFLLEGIALGEAGLYVTLSETECELRSAAASHGWDLESMKFCELTASEDSLRP